MTLAEPHEHHLGLAVDVRECGGAHLREWLDGVAMHLADTCHRVTLGEHAAEA